MTMDIYNPYTFLYSTLPALGLGGNTAPGAASSPTGAAGALPTIKPAAPTDYAPAYGGKPQVPDPAAAAKAAALANQQNMGLYQNLAQSTNNFNYGQLMNQIRAGNPNYDATNSQVSANILAGSQGLISDAVKRNLAQEAAQRGIMRGGVLTNADYLYGLGNTTEQLQGNAANQFAQFTNAQPKVGLYDVTKNYINPDDVYNANVYANLLASAASPAAKGALEQSMLNQGLNAGRNQTAPGVGGGYSDIADILSRYGQGQTAPGVRPVVQPPAQQNTGGSLDWQSTGSDWAYPGEDWWLGGYGTQPDTGGYTPETLPNQWGTGGGTSNYWDTGNTDLNSWMAQDFGSWTGEGVDQMNDYLNFGY